ncbi:hypothetical protein D3C73_1270460 [compost metagenome]
MGQRKLRVETLGDIAFEHATLTVDESRHLRLVVYAAAPEEPRAAEFAHWLGARSDPGAAA